MGFVPSRKVTRGGIYGFNLRFAALGTLAALTSGFSGRGSPPGAGVGSPKGCSGSYVGSPAGSCIGSSGGSCRGGDGGSCSGLGCFGPTPHSFGIVPLLFSSSKQQLGMGVGCSLARNHLPRPELLLRRNRRDTPGASRRTHSEGAGMTSRFAKAQPGAALRQCVRLAMVATAGPRARRDAMGCHAGRGQNDVPSF